MTSEFLVAQAERIVSDDSFKNFRISLDVETALAVHGLLKVEKTVAEVYGREIPLEEDLFVMLSDRFRDAIRASSGGQTSTIDVDINYNELNTIGNVAVIMESVALAPYFLDLNGAFAKAGGQDNKRLRVFFEILSEK